MPQNLLAEKSVQLKKENDHLEGTICIDLETVRLWDNHDPYLYHAYVELKAEDGSLVEVIPYDIGFGRIEIIDKIIYLNGKRLVITGVNRHEWNPKTGRCIGLEDMRADIACMLRNNINSVRTCHYPDQIPWYYMCDNAGIQTGNLLFHAFLIQHLKLKMLCIMRNYHQQEEQFYAYTEQSEESEVSTAGKVMWKTNIISVRKKTSDIHLPFVSCNEDMQDVSINIELGE